MQRWTKYTATWLGSKCRYSWSNRQQLKVELNECVVPILRFNVFIYLVLILSVHPNIIIEMNHAGKTDFLLFAITSEKRIEVQKLKKWKLFRKWFLTKDFVLQWLWRLVLGFTVGLVIGIVRGFFLPDLVQGPNCVLKQVIKNIVCQFHFQFVFIFLPILHLLLIHRQLFQLKKW